MRSGTTRHLPVGAVRLAAVRDEVAPAHMGLVQEIGEIGPRVRPGADDVRLRRSSDDARQGSEVGGARAGIVRVGAASAPPRNQIEVGREAPGSHPFEQMILQDEVVRVGPVVRDLGSRVVPHHVRDRRRLGRRTAGGFVRVNAEPLAALEGCSYEAVHTATVDVFPGGVERMRAARMTGARSGIARVRR